MHTNIIPFRTQPDGSWDERLEESIQDFEYIQVTRMHPAPKFWFLSDEIDKAIERNPALAEPETYEER